MNYKLEIIQDEDEGGYIAYFPELPGCMTSADSLENLIKNIEDCQREWFKAGGKVKGLEPKCGDFKGTSKNSSGKFLGK